MVGDRARCDLLLEVQREIEFEVRGAHLGGPGKAVGVGVEQPGTCLRVDALASEQQRGGNYQERRAHGGFGW